MGQKNVSWDYRARPRIDFTLGVVDQDGTSRRVVLAFVRTTANTGTNVVAIAEFNDPKDAQTLCIGLSLHSKVLFADPETLADVRGRPWLTDPLFHVEAGDDEWLVVADSEQGHLDVAACRFERQASLLAETFSRAERVRL